MNQRSVLLGLGKLQDPTVGEDLAKANSKGAIGAFAPAGLGLHSALTSTSTHSSKNSPPDATSASSAILGPQDAYSSNLFESVWDL